MGIPVFVTGRSGTGKTFSTKRIPRDKACFISVQKPRLPYRGDFEEHYKTDRTFTIIQILKSTDKKIVIIDDAQYLMANEYLRRADEKSYDEFTDIGVSFRQLIDTVDELPVDVVVYFMWHTDTKDGITQMKTVGRMVDQYITPEGLSDIVLETAVVDGKYYFMRVDRFISILYIFSTCKDTTKISKCATRTLFLRDIFCNFVSCEIQFSYGSVHTEIYRRVHV